MDPIADMLTRIRNAQAVRKETVSIPLSKMKLVLAKILKKEGYLEKVKKKEREIIVKLKQDGIEGLKRVSKPGQRIYVEKDKVPKVRQGFGMAVISTSQGLMTDKEARKKKLGGEVICEIW